MISTNSNHKEGLACAYPSTHCSALYRQQPEHFKVYETLNFSPKGEGDHLYLYIKKRDTNTDWLATVLVETTVELKLAIMLL